MQVFCIWSIKDKNKGGEYYMELEYLYVQAQKGSKKARKRLLKKYPRTFKVLQDQEEEKKKSEEEKRRIVEEKQRKENEERKRIEDEEKRKQAEINVNKKLERQRKITQIEQILSSTSGDEDKVGYLKEYGTKRVETPIYGPVKKGPSGWGIVEYADVVGTRVSYEKIQVRKVSMTKREALIRAVVEEKILSFPEDNESSLIFEESEDKVFQAQVDDILNLPYEGEGIFIIKLDGIEHHIPCDNRVLKTFNENGIYNVKYKKRGKINLANIKRAIQRRFYKEER